MGIESIDLAEDVRIGTMVTRRIQEAFKYGIECDIIHGKLLDGASPQGVYAVSDTQSYVLGTRRITPDGRVFRYGRCGATFTDMRTPLKNNLVLVTEKTQGSSDGVNATAAGETEVVITMNGDFWDTAIAVDELRGGYISFYRGTTGDRQQRMILGNTAIAAAGAGDITITLKDALTTALEDDDQVEILANPYYSLVHANDDHSSAMGLPCVIATTGQFLWIQTWGPCRISPVQAEIGINADERLLVFGANAGLRSIDAMSGLSNSEQIAGFILEKTDGVAGSAAPFIMLQISP